MTRTTDDLAGARLLEKVTVATVGMATVVVLYVALLQLAVTIVH
jgi:hypothetical protein